MNIKHTLSDFRAEEHIHFPGECGAYSYYRVEKQNMPIASVREAMAVQLGVTPSAVVFPTFKDIAPAGVHYASVRKQGPARFQGQGFVAHRVQQGPRALRMKDLHGNRFMITVRHLSKMEVSALKSTMQTLAANGLPNYYDDQRFDSLTGKGFIGKAILKGNAEKAVRFYLAEPMSGDSESLCDFKLLVKSHWGQWGYLLHQAPRPSNFRSVITYLKDHPHDYAKATNRIRDHRLSAYLLAYQCWIWNHILARYLEKKIPIATDVKIAGARFPLPDPDQRGTFLQRLTIELPRLTSHYQGDIADVVQAVLKKEEMTLGDFNVRLVQRVCLAKDQRSAWFAPINVTVGKPVIDAHAPKYWAVPVKFTLPPRHYATLVMKTAAARIGTTIEIT